MQYKFNPYMKKVFAVVVFVAVLIASLVSCGSSKHAGKCDAYSLNKSSIIKNDLASN